MSGMLGGLMSQLMPRQLAPTADAARAVPVGDPDRVLEEHPLGYLSAHSGGVRVGETVLVNEGRCGCGRVVQINEAAGTATLDMGRPQPSPWDRDREPEPMFKPDGEWMKLNVACINGQKLELLAKKSWTVEGLQRVIQDRTGVFWKNQRLVFAGRNLQEPEKLLRDTNLVDGAKLLLVRLATGFPEKLGPFETIQVPVQATDFALPPWNEEEFASEGTMWVMEQRQAARLGIRSSGAEFPLCGQFSPTHPVTLTPEEKAAAKIPAAASHFVWSYPVADWGALQGDDVAKSFLTVGGYVYLDGGHKICGATTLLPQEPGVDAGGLQFGTPKNWEPAWTECLMRHGRFQPITIKPLNDCGAWHFCWLRPGEVLQGLDGKPLSSQPSVPHGGFAYLFHHDPLIATEAEQRMDRYFPVISGDEYKAAAMDGESTSGRSSFFQVVSDLAALDGLRDRLAMASTGATVTQSVASLQEQIGRLEVQLESVTKCVVCQDQEKAIHFNCGHVCACRACADQIRACPLCRAEITERRNAYS